MELTRAEAEAEAIRRWYLLPPHQRQSCEDAQAYAIRLDQELEFYSVTNRARLIGAWLIREFFQAREAERTDELVAFDLVQAKDDRVEFEALEETEKAA